MNQTDQEKFNIKLKAAFDRAQNMRQEWMNLAVDGYLLYGYTPEMVKEICAGNTK